MLKVRCYKVSITKKVTLIKSVTFTFFSNATNLSFAKSHQYQASSYVYCQPHTNSNNPDNPEQYLFQTHLTYAICSHNIYYQIPDMYQYISYQPEIVLYNARHAYNAFLYLNLEVTQNTEKKALYLIY